MLFALVAAAPLVAADPLVAGDVCAGRVACLTHVECDTETTCSVGVCGTLLQCDVGVANDSSCAINETIEGHTCDSEQSLGFASLPSSQPVGIATGETGVVVESSQSEGNVSAFNLPNTWTSDAVTLRASVLGLSGPEVGATLYKSTIGTPSHQFTTIDLTVVAGAPASVTLRLMDNAPEDCAVSSDIVGHTTFACRRDLPALP